MGKPVRVYVKKRLVIHELSVPHQHMHQLGTFALSTMKRRTYSGIGPNDAAAKPLAAGYRQFKQRRRLKPIRDLIGTGYSVISRAVKRKARLKFVGHMLDNLLIRTVSENSATAGFAQFAARSKAQFNERREHWLGFSPRDRAAVTAKGNEMLHKLVPGLVTNQPGQRAA